MLLFVLSAQARDCVSGEAPSGYVVGTCGGSAALPDLCNADETASAIWVECRVDENGGAGATDVFLETLGSDDGYVIYGTDANGFGFCCAFDDGDKGVEYLEVWLTPQGDHLDSTQLTNTGASAYPTVKIHGGPGADTLHGPIDPETPYMYLYGDQGSDTLYSYDTVSFSFGGAGDDTLVGDGDGNQLFGDDLNVELTGNDTIYGGGGDDAIYPGKGDDIVYAGAGSDLVHAYDGADEVYGEDGDDWLTGGAHADTLIGGDGDDLIQGEGGDDVLQGNAGADDLYGNSGADTLCSGMTPTKDLDNLHGGGDDDTLWAPTGPTNPSGSDTGGSNTCGHTFHGAFLVSGSCSYTLTAAPAGCS